KRLADADGIVDELRDNSVPIAARAVVEHAAAADEKVVAVTLGEARGDRHGRAAASAGAVSDADLAHRGERVGRVDADAELGGTCVEIERAGLKRRGTLARVEVGEVDEIPQQRGQIAIVAGEAIDVADAVEF